MVQMSKDYFTKLNKRTDPVRQALDPPSPAKVSLPVKVKAPEAPKGVPAGQLQGESLEDFTYMRSAQEKINRKLAPKSVMGKSSPKR